MLVGDNVGGKSCSSDVRSVSMDVISERLGLHEDSGRVWHLAV